MADEADRRDGGTYPEEASARDFAQQIVVSPGLRSRFFDDPQGTVARVVRSRRLLGLRVDEKTKTLRARVLGEVSRQLGNGEKASSVHAEAVTRQFFSAAIRNPERSFDWILRLSVITFFFGAALIVTGIVRSFMGGDTRDVIVASAFGGSGVFAVLGSVLTLSTGTIRLANANHAQLRVILASFATQLGHLRAFKLEKIEQIEQVNGRVCEAMRAAVDHIQARVKVETKAGDGARAAGLVLVPPADGGGAPPPGAATRGEGTPVGAPAGSGGNGARGAGEEPAGEPGVPIEGEEDPNRPGGS